MQKPPPFVLTEAVHTTATAPPGMRINPSTGTTIPNSGRFGPPRNTSRYQQVLQHFTGPLEAEYQGKTTHIPLTIEADLAAARQEVSTHPLPPAASLIRELGVRNTVIQRKSQQLLYETQLSHGFYGSDPTDKTVFQFLSRAQIVDPILSPNGPGMNLWKQSYRAALEARLLAQTLTVLHQQQANVHNWLTTVQANEQAQAAAAEAARQAAEHARIAAEQQREQERRDRERAREAQEVKAREDAHAKQMADSNARLEHLNNWLISLDTARALRPFLVSSSFATSNPVFTVNAGQVAARAATAAAIRAALQAGIVTATTAAVTTSSVVLVGFAALLFPAPLGNSDARVIEGSLSDFVPKDRQSWIVEVTDFKPDEIRALSVPLADLATVPIEELNGIALTNGDIDLPVTLGSRTMNNATEFFVASTHNTGIASRTPVRLARFDSSLNVFRVDSPDTPSIGMTWTPIVKPANNSTALPASKPNIVVYDGTAVAVLEGRIDTHPELDAYSFGGFITVFPADSGISPVFTMFRDRRQDPGIATGNGQVVSGNWLGAASTPEGAPIPAQIADKLRGREFSSFKAFRRAFWKAVAADSDLDNKFTQINKLDIRKGISPVADKSERVGGRVKLEIHHVNPISEGGSVYDIDNLKILTPKQHIGTHTKKETN
ncbi:S-type pyocin [Pseudomonas baetica]|uniref:S-type pyocin n=1 Tax=Pseudomonas baetica TaxID=674054 RepID=A0ABX4PSJ2_9PSED|nr:S-type pyocin domain-containing protein [Pseudomonas baetica]PKA68001.1 S-type pyocin [Pseudomonas baetica]PTC18118.1 colicin transporter [Pseudomonas baetica]